MLDLEFAVDAVSNDELPESTFGAPIVDASQSSAPARPVSVVAGHRLMLPGLAPYSAMEEVYKDMYAEYYYRDGIGAAPPHTGARGGGVGGSEDWYETYYRGGEGTDMEPTVVLPADAQNGKAVMLTAFSNQDASSDTRPPLNGSANAWHGRRTAAPVHPASTSDASSHAAAGLKAAPSRTMHQRSAGRGGAAASGAEGASAAPAAAADHPANASWSSHSAQPKRAPRGAPAAPAAASPSATAVPSSTATADGAAAGADARPNAAPARVEAPPEWVKEQSVLAGRAILDDSNVGFVLPWDEKPMSEAPSLPGLEHCPPSVLLTPDGRPPNALRVVGGLDISFLKDTNIAVASLVVMEFPSLRVLHTEMLHCEMNVPYIPYFLAFREVEPLQRVIQASKVNFPSAIPQLYLVDGNGALHPRKCGLATHLGVLIDAPTIGVAKKLLNVDGLADDETAIEKVKAKAAASGKSTAWDAKVAPLVGRSGRTWGYGALTGNSVAKPVFISAGHRVSHLTAARLALSMAPFRVVEPIRQADLGSREYIKKHFNEEHAATAAAAAAVAAPPSAAAE